MINDISFTPLADGLFYCTNVRKENRPLLYSQEQHLKAIARTLAASAWQELPPVISWIPKENPSYDHPIIR
jgi:hypothetical protein